MLSEKLKFTDAQINQANSINIIEYVQQAGYKIKQVSSKSYKIPGYGGLYINADGHKWNSFSQDTGGGAIQFVMHMEGKSWVEAVKRLLGLNYSPVEQMDIEKRNERKSDGIFVLPEKNETCKHIFAYLIGQRKIDKKLVYDLVNSGKIYENKYNSCVFVGHNEQGNTRYASIRSTNSNGKHFRGEISNSDKSYSFNIKGSSRNLCIFESPIDLMSYITLYKIFTGKDFDDHSLSLGGVSFKALDRYLMDNPTIKRLRICLDNDEAGRSASEKIKDKYSESYQCYIHVPKRKDWNDDLVYHIANSQFQNEFPIKSEISIDDTDICSSQ